MSVHSDTLGVRWMRLLADKIKEAMLHPDQSVRETAIYYLADVCSHDPAIMSLAIQAFERYGLDAFSSFSFLSDLVQTSESIIWLMKEIERVGESTEEKEINFAFSLRRVLRRSDTDLLMQHFDTIQSMQHLGELSQRVIADRIDLDSRMVDELWSEFDDFCMEHKDDSLEDEDWEHAHALIAALARDRDRACQQVMHILEDPEKYSGWDEVFIARLAGELRLEAATALLADRLAEPETLVCQEAIRALQKIGTDAIVRELAHLYVEGDWGIRLTVASILEKVRTDLSVRTCLELLNKEEDELIRGLLLEAVLMNFCVEGIEPARQHVLKTDKNPEMLEVRSALLVACTLLGESFPEFQAWQANSKHDTEFRRQWYKDHPFKPITDDTVIENDEEVDDIFDEDDDDEPTPTVVSRNKRIGRNDPCPCGSGKKFKKCCYGKVDVGEETDSDHAAALSGFHSDTPTKKYPIGTIAYYGPDDRTITKIVAAVVKSENAKPILERWVGTTVSHNPKVQRQIKALFDRHKVKSVIATGGNIGCPHEEGMDFPRGEDCPFCPFWAGKQGSAQRD